MNKSLIAAIASLVAIVGCGGGGGDSGGEAAVVTPTSTSSSSSSISSSSSSSSVSTSPMNSAPIASDADVTIVEDQKLSGTFPAATDANGDAVAYTLVVSNLPLNGWVTFTGSNTYTYQPNPNFNGSDSFAYRVSDNKGGVNTYTVRVTITPVNDAPIVVGGPFAFGLGDGVVTLAVKDHDFTAKRMVLQGDGKILVVGESFSFTSGDVISLLRLNPDGSLDSGFGGGDGIVMATQVGGGDDLILQPDGKILVAGCTSWCGSTEVKLAVTRFNTDGSLDMTFGGGDGIAAVALGVKSDNSVQSESRGIALQSDGKIVIAGYTFTGINHDFAVVRFNSDGSVDSGFGGGDGIVTTPIGAGYDAASDLALQVDGKIVVVGGSNIGTTTICALARYLPDGALDLSFGGGDGIATVQYSTGFSTHCNAVEVLSDGRVLLAGSTSDGRAWQDPSPNFALMRFNPDGTLDATFEGPVDGPCNVYDPNCRLKGFVLTPVTPGKSDTATSLRLLGNGDFFLAGGTDTSITAAALVRYKSNGTLDTSFGGDGIVTINVSSTYYTWAVDAVAQSDGKALMTAEIFGETAALIRYNADGSLDQYFAKKNRLREGQPFIFALPPGRFSDADGDALIVAATLADGSALPSWITFDPVRALFTGLVPSSAPDLQLRVRATDPSGLGVDDSFALLTVQ